MNKLFITPRHGYLGEIIDKLREHKYEVTLIGWGYPPIFVEADKSQHQDIRDFVEDIDEEVKFSPYRLDLLSASELNEKIGQLDDAQFIILCDELGISRSSLSGFQIGNKSTMIADLVSRQTKNESRLTKLLEALNKLDPGLF